MILRVEVLLGFSALTGDAWLPTRRCPHRHGGVPGILSASVFREGRIEIADAATGIEMGKGMILPMDNDLSSRRWLILSSTVVSFLAVGVTFFAVPPLAAELVTRFGLSHFAVGMLMGVIGVPAIFLSIPLGAAVDRWPARAAGNISLALMFLGSVLFAFAPSYAILLLGRGIFGVGGLVINLLLARLVTTAFAGRELSLAMECSTPSTRRA